MKVKLQFDKEGMKINDEKIFPLCAEFHYWRMDPRWWDDVLHRLIKGAGLDLVASYIPWSVHEPIKDDFDFTGRRNPRANLKGFLDLVHKNGLYFFARSGPLCYGEIDGGGPTDYANITGKRSKRFIELSEAWIEAVSALWKEYSIYNGGPLIYLQVDNEICPADTWWQEFLEQRYNGDIEALNRAWDSNFANFEQAAASQEFFRGKKERIGGVNWKSTLDVMEYKTRYFPVTYGGTLARMFRKHGTDVPMMLNNTFLFLQDWYSMQEAPEIISGGLDHYAYYLIPGDSYYWDYLYVSLNTNICHFPWSPEFQCGSGMMGFGPATSQHQKLVTLFSLAAGMLGVNYYMFVERERWEGYCPVTEDAKIRPEWFAHRHIFRVLREIDWVNLKKQCQIGLLWHQEHYWEYLYNGGGIIQPDDYTVVGAKDYGHLAQEPLWLYLKTLIDTDTDFSMVDVRTDLSQHSLLFYAAPPFMTQEGQQRLVDYVKGGGKLVFLSPPPHLDEEKNECRVLIDSLGLSRGEAVNTETQIGNLTIHLSEAYDKLTDFQPLLKTAEGRIAACRKKIDKGEVILVGFSALEAEVFRLLLEALEAPLFVRSTTPEFVHTHLFRSRERAVVFAINRHTDAVSTTIKILPDLKLTEEHQCEEMFTHKMLPFSHEQVIELTIPGKDVAVLEIKERSQERIDLDKDKLIQGYFERV